MASKPIVHQQQKDLPGGGRETKRVPALEPNSRRVLGDIGNRINVAQGGADGKLHPQPLVSRPVTRGFCAKLDKAHVADKKPADSLTDDVSARGGVRTSQKAVNRVQRIKEVIIISPNTESGTSRRKKASGTKKCQQVSRKKVQTLTSVLLCHDIDSVDAQDQLAVVEYVEEIYKFYKHIEESSRIDDYMSSQTEINEKMRAILTDWLIEVHSKFQLMPETLYLTVYVVDRYLSLNTVVRRQLQLVGMAAMLIASKYEEIWAPEVSDLICISDRAYNREQILVMEKLMLNKLEWTLTVPTPYVFIVRFLKASRADKDVEHLVFFLVELGLMNYSVVMLCPSLVAASAVYAAMCTLDKSPPWTETLEHHSGYTESQLLESAALLVSFHLKVTESKLKAVFKKYSSPQCNGVALLPPAKKLLKKKTAAAIC